MGVVAGLGGNPFRAEEHQEIRPEHVEVDQQHAEHRAGQEDLDRARPRRPRPARPASAARMASLLQKPASGKTPAIDRQPIRKVQCVTGISRRRPPMRRMSITPPMACITLPAPRNNRALKKAWVSR